MKTLLLLACSAALACAAPVPKELKKDDLSRLAGEWWEARFNDTVNADAADARRFSFNKDGSAGIHQRAGAAPSEYTFTIDQTTAPPSFSWKGKSGESYNAAYRLDGDTLSIVFSSAKNPRPKEVKFGAGDVYYELKRVK